MWELTLGNFLTRVFLDLLYTGYTVGTYQMMVKQTNKCFYYCAEALKRRHLLFKHLIKCCLFGQMLLEANISS